MMKLNECNGCPAIELRTPDQIQKIEYWNSLFDTELRKIDKVRVILLGESYPANRYFYDLISNYEHAGLMFNLLREFEYSNGSELLKYFHESGIIVNDCAFCPLHLLDNKSAQRQSATHCLIEYKLGFFEEHPVPIITFFPSKRGFLKRQLPDIQSRVIAEFGFNSLYGIKRTIEKILATHKS